MPVPRNRIRLGWRVYCVVIMQITFHGAARGVTGSCHLVECGGTRILLDCGLIQGGRERHERNRTPFPFAPATIDAVVLSHAHIDHSGRPPLLRKHGYRGPIFTTATTARLLEIMLADSGHIQEEDARWKIKRLKKQKQDASWVTPLYTEQDALALLGQLVPVGLGYTESLPGGAQVTFVPAGHILGAAIIELRLDDDGTTRRLVFSGDLGVQGSRLLPPPRTVERPDYLIMESTYGDREREDEDDRTEMLFDIISDTTARGGKVIIPSFAVGRTQEILTRLNDLVETGRLPGLRVFVDSPMAVAATKAFALHPESYSGPVRELLASGDHLRVWHVYGGTSEASSETHDSRCQEPVRLRGLPGRQVARPDHSVRRLAGADLRPFVSAERPGRDHRGLLCARGPHGAAGLVRRAGRYTRADILGARRGNGRARLRHLARRSVRRHGHRAQARRVRRPVVTIAHTGPGAPDRRALTRTASQP